MRHQQRQKTCRVRRTELVHTKIPIDPSSARATAHPARYTSPKRNKKPPPAQYHPMLPCTGSPIPRMVKCPFVQTYKQGGLSCSRRMYFVLSLYIEADADADAYAFPLCLFANIYEQAKTHTPSLNLPTKPAKFPRSLNSNHIPIQCTTTRRPRLDGPSRRISS